MNDWGLGDSVNYGTGESYQASCPGFPPPPAGYVAWSENVNGAVPANVVARAKALSNDMTKSLGYTETIYSGGVPLLLRVDAHTWTTDASGNAVAGCFHGVDVWVPSPNGAQSPTPSQGFSTSGKLFALSLGLGVIVSALSIYEFVRRR